MVPVWNPLGCVVERWPIVVAHGWGCMFGIPSVGSKVAKGCQPIDDEAALIAKKSDCVRRLIVGVERSELMV